MTNDEKLTWVERLNNLLLERALYKFAQKEVSFEEFKAFIEETIFLPEVGTEFIDAIYNEYLIKINVTGEGLTNKVSDKINEAGESLNDKMNDEEE